MLDLIQTFCREQGVTIEQFEKVIKVSPGYVYKLKDHQPGMAIARKLAVILGMSLEDIHELYMR